MTPVKDTYKGSFFSRRARLNWRVPYVCNSIHTVYKPRSLIDVGCATAEFVRGFIALGVDAYGLEGSENCIPFLQVPNERVLIFDLRNLLDFVPRKDGWGSWDFLQKFDAALCLEVAEHIDPESVDVFVENLVRLSDNIVMSFAPPGQRGHYHLNCQESSYWVDKFSKHGYVYRRNLVEAVQKGWEVVKDRKEMRSYYCHLLCFEG